jgi:glycosyltransferase involved in cell wall biosynthesis
MKKISILISIYNSGEWIEDRLNNIFESTSAEDFEVICINSDSPDPRDDVIPRRYPVKYLKLDKRVTIYEAWNIGILESNSEYITNMNSDDLNHKSYCDIMSRTLDGKNDIGVSYCSWHTIGSDIKKWSDIDVNKAVDGSPGNFAGSFDSAQIGHMPMWRKSIHDEIGYFRTDMPALGDAEMWMRIWQQTNYNFLWVRQALGAYRWRNGENAWHKYITPKEWEKFHGLVAERSQNSIR